MDIKSTFELIQGNKEAFVIIVTLLTTIASNLLAMLEYFVNKAYWDYFFIDDSQRNKMRSGFNPEQLCYGIIVVIVLFLVFELTKFNKNLLIIVSIIVYIAIIFILRFVIRSFTKPLRDEIKILNSGEYNKNCRKMLFMVSLTVILNLIIFTIGSYIYNKVYSNIIWLIIPLIIMLILTIMLLYGFKKSQIKNYKMFKTIKIGNEDFIILNENVGYFYCVKYEPNEGNICIDKIKLIESHNQGYDMAIIQKHQRKIGNETF
ncbi:MAG: hypothetical protein FWF46_05530 [Oscillospiraceae bacterium]|nr:hypothetical protein [Oscillospiraceae bacterium]